MVAAGAALAIVAVACTGPRSPGRPDEACEAACAQRVPRCSAAGCARGCSLALDRLVEGEGEHVLACVEKSQATCDDWLWADCAVRVGAHADGGPPPPVNGPRH